MIVEVPDLTGAECGDIATTAAEGGIGYWSQIEHYDWRRWTKPDDSLDNIDVPADFVFYTIWQLKPDERGYDMAKPIDITPALIRRGFETGLKADLNKGGWAFAGLLKVPRDDWTGEIDSDIADLIIQFGAFGEVVYG